MWIGHTPGISTKLRRLDIPSMIILLGAIICFLLALQWAGPSKSWSSPTVIGLLIGSIALLAMFFVIGNASGVRAFQLWRLRNKIFTVFGIFKFINSGVSLILFYYLPLYLQTVSDFEAKDSGFLIIPITATIPISSIFAIAISSIAEIAQLFMVVGCILATVSSGLFYTLDMSSGIGRVIGYQILAGVGHSFSNNVAANVILGSSIDLTDRVFTSVALSSWHYFSGAIWLAVAQALSQAKLLLSLDSVQGFDPSMVFAAGATNFRSQISENLLVQVVKSYVASLRNVFTLCIGLNGSAFIIVILFMIWRMCSGRLGNFRRTRIAPRYSRTAYAVGWKVR